MTKAEALRILVVDLDAQGRTPDEIASILGIPVARVDVILDEHDAAQGVPHPERAHAPVLEPLGGPAVITSQAAATGGREPLRKVVKREPKPKPPPKPKPEPKAPKPKKPAREPIECGTYGGRGKHVRAGEPICDPCRLAYNAWQRAKYDQYGSRTKNSRKEIEHGTPAGYRAHVRRGEESCEPCLTAYTQSKRTPIKHGTRGGYVQHRRRKEEACDECKAANTANSRQKRAEAS